KTGYYNQALIPKIQITDMFLDGTGQDLSKFILSTIKKESGNAIPYALKVTQRVPSKDNPNLFTLFLEGVTPIELSKDSLGENYTLNLKVHHRASDLSQPADIDLSRTFVIDETLPVISSNNIASGKYYRAAFDPSFKVSEKFLNKTDSYISVIKNGTLLSNTKFTSNNITEDGNGGFALKNLIREDGKYEVIVHVEDMAGNASKDFTERFFVDSKIATPSITNIENNRNYNSNIIPIITINDEFLTSEDFAKGDATDAASKKLVYATLNGNPYKLTLNTNAKGVLTIQGEEISANTPRGTLNVLKIYTKDRAAKDNGEPLQTDEKTFVIDKISPTITFKDANNRNIENGGFYQGIVNPVIHFEDNYVIDEKSVSLNGNSYKGKFVTTEDGYTFTGDTITTDGLYTITATGMDKATNKARTFQITFSLDNTKPNIIITGVQDNEFNNKNVTTPLVKVIDTNNLLSTTSFKLTKNGVQVPVKAELGDQGIFNFNVMDEGLYKLNVASTDKAGNSYTTPTLTFTINRTKPIMKFNINNGDYINKAFTPTITTISALDTATVFDLTISGQPINPNKIPLLTANKPYELKAKAKDKAGNISDEVTLNFVLDTISPEINILGLISNFFYNKTITPLVTSKDTNPSTFVMALNNKTYNNETITAEGTYELKLVATDKAKNITQKVLSFVIDKTKPVINIQGVLDGKSYNSIIKPLIDVNDNSVVSVLLDGVDYHGEAIEKDGKHTIIIKAVDKSGNLSETTINFLIKMTPPTIKISGVEDNKTYKLAISPTIILSDDALSDSTIIALDDRAYVSGDTISTEGSHVLKVETRDAVGNAAAKSLKFNINITKSSLSMNLLGDKKVVAASGGSLIGVSLILLMIFKLRKKKLSKKQYHRGN
ncbi:MAG: Ig-like domain repeat protein, partial [Clostridiaceae bacterium]|nr:Ig-like domain repeat protein [Clostridiaceae bacterium]